MRKYRFSILILCVFLAAPVSFQNVEAGSSSDVAKRGIGADGIITWFEKYGGPGHESGFEVHPVGDGTFIAVGHNAPGGNRGNGDGLIMKLDKRGDVIWKKTWGAHLKDSLYSVSPMPGGGYCAGGMIGKKLVFKEDTGLASMVVEKHLKAKTGSYVEETDFMLLLVDEDGEVLWSKEFGESGNQALNYVDATEDDGCLATGYEKVYKYDSEGNVLWGWDAPRSTLYSVKERSEGGFIVAGTKKGKLYVGDRSADRTEYWDLSMDSENGGFKDAEKASYAAVSAWETEDSYIMFGGYQKTNMTDIYSVVVGLLDLEGNIQWTEKHGEPGKCEVPHSAEPTRDGGMVLAGRMGPCGSTVYDGFIMKVDMDGQEEWKRVFEMPGDDWLNHAEPADDGGYITTGRTSTATRGGYDFWVMKLDSEGRCVDCRKKALE